MIAVRLMGGLGNQLFQYAFGRQAADRLGVPLALDLRWFDHFDPVTTPRAYELGRYPIRAAIAPPKSLPAYPPRFLSRLAQPLLDRLTGRMRAYERHQPGFHPDSAVPRDNTLYIGYWQSEKYFPDVADQLRVEFAPRTPPDAPNAEYADAIRGCEAVSVHVRRGDYASTPHVNTVHGLAPLDYYREAIRRIRGAVSAARFFVFSDDLAWCRENLPLGPSAVFVQGNDGDRAFEDLRLMSLCRHHVVANSSFSWWGAWLNPNPDKVVIAPRRWFADPSIDTTDLVPPSWIQL